MFASLDAYRILTQSRRGDIQTIMFIMIYLFNECHLPWSELGQRFNCKSISVKQMINERLSLEMN